MQLGRVHDVGEQHGREDRVQFERRGRHADEVADRAQHLRLLMDRGDAVAGAGEQAHRCPRHHVDQIGQRLAVPLACEQQASARSPRAGFPVRRSDARSARAGSRRRASQTAVTAIPRAPTGRPDRCSWPCPSSRRCPASISRGRARCRPRDSRQHGSNAARDTTRTTSAPVGEGRGEEHVHRAALELAAQDRAVGADRVEHLAEVGHPRFEVGHIDVAARGAGPPAIVQDQPRERGQAAEPGRVLRNLPQGVDAP